MNKISGVLPLRQKILLGLTIVVGLSLMICSIFDLLRQDIFNRIILFYGIGVPLLLLTFDTVVDLNKKNIFGIWLTISIILFVISLMASKSDEFIIHRSTKFSSASDVNRLINGYSTSSLKALLIFLIAYWLLNKLLNKRGLFIINTFWQANRYHNVAQRKITGFDIMINFILFVIIILSSLF